MGCHGVFVLCCKYKETLSFQASAYSSWLLFTKFNLYDRSLKKNIRKLVFIYFAIFLMGGKMLSLHSFCLLNGCSHTFLLWNLQLSLAFSSKQTPKNYLNTSLRKLYLSDSPQQTFLSRVQWGQTTNSHSNKLCAVIGWWLPAKPLIQFPVCGPESVCVWESKHTFCFGKM